MQFNHSDCGESPVACGACDSCTGSGGRLVPATPGEAPPEALREEWEEYVGYQYYLAERNDL